MKHSIYKKCKIIISGQIFRYYSNYISDWFLCDPGGDKVLGSVCQLALARQAGIQIGQLHTWTGKLCK